MFLFHVIILSYFAHILQLQSVSAWFCPPMGSGLYFWIFHRLSI